MIEPSATLPRILVFDEKLARDRTLQTEFCRQTGIWSDSTQPPTDASLLALASFCSGQNERGAVVCNDYETIRNAIADVSAGERWAMVLLNIGFSYGQRKVSQHSPADEKTFGLTTKRNLARDFPTLPVVLFSHTPRHEIAADSSCIPYLHKIGLTRRKITETLLRWGLLSMEQERRLLGIEPEVVAASQETLNVFRTAYIHADDGLPILLLGESGTGKEVLARYIHKVSPRCDKQLVAVNVTALSPTLVESELFGHEKGAFTGAIKAKEGCFQRAHKGILFLDEIGDLSIDIQAKLLRVIQEREITPVGGTKISPTDVVLISATNADLTLKAGTGAFRPDLLYRINAIPITIPPLRERPEEIIPLAQNLLQRAQNRQGKQGITLSDEAMEILTVYPFPGNIREMENIIGRLVGRTWDHDMIGGQAMKTAIDEGIGVSLMNRRRSDQHPCPSPSAPQSTPTERTEEAPLSPSSLPGLFTRIAVKRDDDTMRGFLPTAESAYRSFMARLAGMDLARTARQDNSLNLQAAMSFLAGKPLRGRAPASQLKKMLGLDRNEAIGADTPERLKDLIEKWQQGYPLPPEQERGAGMNGQPAPIKPHSQQI